MLQQGGKKSVYSEIHTKHGEFCNVKNLVEHEVTTGL